MGVMVHIIHQHAITVSLFFRKKQKIEINQGFRIAEGWVCKTADQGFQTSDQFVFFILMLRTPAPAKAMLIRYVPPFVNDFVACHTWRLRILNSCSAEAMMGP